MSPIWDYSQDGYALQAWLTGTTRSLTPSQRVCRLLSRGADGRVGINSASLILTCMQSLPSQTYTQSWMNKHACPRHPTLFKAHCRRLQEWYIFITDVINTKSPTMFWGVLIAQQNELIRSINQWPLGVTGMQDKKTQLHWNCRMVSPANCQLSFLISKAALGKVLQERKIQVVDVTSSFITKWRCSREDFLSALTESSLCDIMFHYLHLSLSLRATKMQKSSTASKLSRHNPSLMKHFHISPIIG